HQADHVHPTKVKGENLFSFRYRHFSADDIDILTELRSKFHFAMPPIERNLVRANICSTCQQRLRRARQSRLRRQCASPGYAAVDMPPAIARPTPVPGDPFHSRPQPAFGPPAVGPTDPTLLSALRSTLRDVRPGPTLSARTSPSGGSSAGGSAEADTEDELDVTHVDLAAAESRQRPPLSMELAKPARPLSLVLPPPLLLPMPQSPLPTLPPPHMLLLELRKGNVLGGGRAARYHSGIGRLSQTSAR
ncbi:hypothetical protein H4R19_003023, partial [Coemansia spiralis]